MRQQLPDHYGKQHKACARQGRSGGVDGRRHASSPCAIHSDLTFAGSLVRFHQAHTRRKDRRERQKQAADHRPVAMSEKAGHGCTGSSEAETEKELVEFRFLQRAQSYLDNDPGPPKTAIRENAARNHSGIRNIVEIKALIWNRRNDQLTAAA